MSILMRYLRDRQPAMLGLFALLLLGGFGVTEPDCSSPDVRASVIKTVSDNSNNALVEYAVKKSDALKARIDGASTEADKSAILEKARQSAVYRLGDVVTATSKSKDKRTVSCSGTMFTTVEGTTAQKQVDFKVQKTPDGKISVSVSPFQFEPSKD